MTKVLIVEDERLALETLCAYVRSAPDRYSLVEYLRSAANVDLYCLKNQVDLILMDVCTAENASGLEAAARVKASSPDTRVIIVTSAPEYSFLSKARAAGADSFWYKDASEEELLRVMDRTMAGESVYPQQTPRVELGKTFSDQMTQKEIEVMYYLVEGKSLKEIAGLMEVDYETAKTHLRNIKEKLHCSSIAQVAAAASRARLILPEY